MLPTESHWAGCQDSMIDFKDCVSLPTFTGEFSLTIDNCIPDLQV